MTTLISAITIVGLLSFGGGYFLGRKRAFKEALMDPRHDCVMATFHLILLKKLDEKDYDTVRGGIEMRARQYVHGYRMHEKSLSKKKLREFKEKIPGYELIESAEELCGPLGPIDADEINRRFGIDLNNLK